MLSRQTGTLQSGASGPVANRTGGEGVRGVSLPAGSKTACAMPVVFAEALHSFVYTACLTSKGVTVQWPALVGGPCPRGPEFGCASIYFQIKVPINVIVPLGEALWVEGGFSFN